MTRNGKIARLPRFLREKLNLRLEDGEPAKELVKWLNGLPVMKEVLAERFGGRPVSEQNLSEWKQGGYQDWLRHQETRALAADFLEEAEELEEEVGETAFADRLCETMALALARLLREALALPPESPQRRGAILEIARELARLRRVDHQMDRVLVQRERWDYEHEKALEKDRKMEIQEMKSRAMAPIWAAMKRPAIVQLFGGGETGEKIADFFDFVNFGKPIPNWTDQEAEAASSSQGESEPIKPNQSKSNQIKPDKLEKKTKSGLSPETPAETERAAKQP